MAQFSEHRTPPVIIFALEKSVDAVNKAYYGSNNMNMSYYDTTKEMCEFCEDIAWGRGSGGGGGVRPNP